MNREQVFKNVEAALGIIQRGEMIILVDDEDRENEGDLVFAAEFVTAAKINFMAKEARGLICLSLEPHLVDKLNLPLMLDTRKREPAKSTAFTVSIEARHGVTTGISAQDRAHTIKTAIDNNVQPDDVVVPGHIFPLRAKLGGVLERSGHTEGSVDLCKLAHLKPASVICEIMNDDGTMARAGDLKKFSDTHNIPVISIAELIQYRLFRESLVEKVETLDEFIWSGKKIKAALYRSDVDQLVHLALFNFDKMDSRIADVRVHRQKTLPDLFGDQCSMHYARKLLTGDEPAVFVYLASNEHFSFKSPDHAAENPMTDDRLYGIGAQILKDLGVEKMRIHVSTPRPLKALSGYGLEVVESIMMESGK